MRQLEARKEKQDNRMTLTLFLIFVFFILCTVPPHGFGGFGLRGEKVS